jgi:putative ABC transport system permease protein
LNGKDPGKTYLKTIAREIRQSFGRFAAIFAIIALGAGFLAGLLAATPDMKLSMDRYFDDTRMMDLFIKSAAGFTGEDLRAVRELDGTAGVLPAYVTDALVKTPGEEFLAARIYGLPPENLGEGGFINRVELLEGRTPQRDDECLAQEGGGFFARFRPGVVLTVTGENSGDIYAVTQYTVTGIVKSPLYISTDREPCGIGNGRLGTVIYVRDTAYALPVYTDLFLTVRGASSLTAFTGKYQKLIDAASERIGALGEKRAKIRRGEIIAAVRQDLAAAETGYREGRDMAELAAANTRWHVLDRNANAGCVNYKRNAEKIDAVAKVFPVFFLLVAALVALTTMTRMVEEERTQIGALKALGYRKRVIASKYLVYGGLTSVLGSAAGAAGGFWLLPRIIYRAFGTMYHLPPLVTGFNWSFAGISCGAALLCTLGVTMAACGGTLREKPAALMLPRVPRPGKRIFLEYLPWFWKSLKFTHKISARNLFRYKKHFFMTVTGIAGCTALMTSGFGLRDSLISIARTHFDDILRYDLRIELREDRRTGEAPGEALSAAGRGFAGGAPYLELHSEEGRLVPGDGTEGPGLTIYVPREAALFPDYVRLRNRKTGGAIPFSDSSVVLTEKIADLLKLEAGDPLILENAAGKQGTLILTGITENYVGSAVYVGAAAYGPAFGADPPYRTLFVHTGLRTLREQDAALTGIVAAETAAEAEFVSQTQRSYGKLLSSVNFVVLILIFAAGGLAVIVLYNLTNININERRRELATLRVLGFRQREAAAYIFRETSILSVIGAGTGLLLGIPLHRFIISAAENTDLMFGRRISALSFIAAALLTLAFSALVDLMMVKKIRRVRMADSMKAGDS